MPAKRFEVIAHPVRLRILIDIAGRERTPYEIQRALPDISQASLYRHIKILCGAGLLTVVRETPIRGAVEKVYALTPNVSGEVDNAEFAETTREDHLRYFSDFLAVLLAQYRLYVQQPNFNPIVDGFGYHTTPVNMTHAENAEFHKALDALEKKAQDYPPAPERHRHLLTMITIPIELELKTEENDPQ